MSCEVSNSSSFSDAGFDDTWAKAESANGGEGGADALDAIADFNASFENNANDTALDPRFAFCSTPASTNSQYDNSGFASNEANTIEQDGTAPSALNSYPLDFASQAPSSPYFQFIENSPAPAYQSLSIHNNYRRSVSEPPGTLPMQRQPPAPAMTFHRENHYLGEPIPQKPMQLKSLPRNKQTRGHPYQRRIEQQPQQQPPPQYYRPDHRHAQTQPGRGGPTSTPYYAVPPQYFPSTTASDSQFLSSRVCSPAASSTVLSPPVDPLLNAVSVQTAQPVAMEPKNVLSIPLTIDELRKMIVEAVQKALANVDAKEGEDPSSVREDVLEQPVIPHETVESVASEAKHAQ